MSKDGPKSGRMGFGYRQAVEAGAPYDPPRSSAAINLEAFLARHPEHRPRVQDRLTAGGKSHAILSEIQEEGLDGRYALDVWRDVGGENWVKIDYSDNLDKLREEAEWGMSRRVYGYALLWEYGYDTGEWTELQTWSRDPE